jgi:hypothetical protein
VTDARRIIRRVIVEHNAEVITSSPSIDEVDLTQLMSLPDAMARLDAGETVAQLTADPPYVRGYLAG